MRGYVLAEVLIVLTILSVIVIVSYPRVLNTLQQFEENRYQEFVNNVKVAAKVYIEKNEDEYNLENPEDTVIITIGDLVEAGVYNETTKNPKTQEPADLYDEILVRVTANYVKEYTYPFDE